MTNPELLTLAGCAPTPLASYLKALGILRLISSDANHVCGRAADPKVRGWWENERFHLKTVLHRDALGRFFLEEYAPSPIIAPWNGRAGFLEGTSGEASTRTGAKLMAAIEASKAQRLENMRRVIRSLRESSELRKFDSLRTQSKALEQELRSLSGNERSEKEQKKKRVEKKMEQSKSLLLPTLRSITDAEHLSYLDACYVLSAEEAAAPLLGSGGNDGSRDFGVNFAERLSGLFDFDDGSPTSQGSGEIETALYGTCARLDGRGSMGQYSPGQGGPNATTGYEGYSPQNSWDLVLVMEGTIVFAGALTRRWGKEGSSQAAFPFTFQPTNAGAGSLNPEDPNPPRGEIWVPLWTKPATFSEISATCSEGRLTLGQRAARTGLDAARSVARVGLSRGIGSFERYSIIQPGSKMPYQATPLGRIHAPSRPHRDLIEDLDTGSWLTKTQQLIANKKNAPARARTVMRQFENSMFQMTDANQTSKGICNALVALGELVSWIATNPGVRKELPPPPAMSSAWIQRADDGTPEFRIAAALAGLGHAQIERRDSVETVSTSENKDAENSGAGVQETSLASSQPTLPMAAHFAPVDVGGFFNGQELRKRRAWSSDKAQKSVVWGAGGLVSNMISVLERRLVEGTIRKLEDKPLGGAVHARLADVGAFLSAGFNDMRCAALLAGMVWVRPAWLPMKTLANDGTAFESVPFALAALKPIFTPDRILRRIQALSETERIPIPPGLVVRLRAGGNSQDGYTTDAVVRAALARARSSGLPSPFGTERAGSLHSGGEFSRIGTGLRADRLAAALLIPMNEYATKILVKRAYPGVFTE